MAKYYAGIMAVVMLVFSSCYYDVEEDIYPSLECSTENITFDNAIENIIKNRCYKCHNAATNTAGINLEGYANLKKYADNGKLLGTVAHKPGFSPMPKNEPKLVACEIAKIEAWIAAGTP